MMKKIVLVLAIFFCCFMLSSAKEYKPSGAYSIVCYKCKDRAITNKYVGCCPGCFAWRMHSKEKSGYFVYHCQHGHVLTINIKTGEKK